MLKQEVINLISPMVLKKENLSLIVELSHSSMENLLEFSDHKVMMFILNKLNSLSNKIANMLKLKYVVETEPHQHGSELCNLLNKNEDH